METQEQLLECLFVDLNNRPTSLVGPPTKNSRQFAKGVGRNSAGQSVIIPIWNGQLVRLIGPWPASFCFRTLKGCRGVEDCDPVLHGDAFHLNRLGEYSLLEAVWQHPNNRAYFGNCSALA